MGMIRASIVVLFLSVLASCSVAHTAKEYEVDEDPESTLPDADVAAITALASELGVAKVKSIAVETPFLPLVCRVAVVRGYGRQVAPYRRKTPVAYVVQNDWPDCFGSARGAELFQGGWRTREDAARVDETWRVWDGEWHVDVRFDSGISHATATRLILAVRHRTLVIPEDRPRLYEALSKIDPDDFCDVMYDSTDREDDGVRGTTDYGQEGQTMRRLYLLLAEPDPYSVSLIRLKIVGDEIELLDLGMGIR